MSKKDITSVRGTIEWLKGEGDDSILTVKEEIDRDLEVAGVVKALDNGPAILFENIKGYPGVRNIVNIFAREDRVARMFDVDDWRKLKFKVLEGMRHPIAPKIVDKAPCQEVVITKDFDIPAMLPINQYTERDGTRVMGCGIQFMSGQYFRGGTHVSFNRQVWRKDWCTMAMGQFTHLGGAVYKTHVGQNIPITININPPPAVLLVAGEGGVRTIIIPGDDEIGIAGTLQGQPVEIVKAKTVDAYACAQSEWVIEGYITPEREWETGEGEALGKVDVTPFFPEWPRYLGKTWKVPKFQATAITHRKNPIFHTPLADSFEGDLGFPLREATFFELADRIAPGFVTDVSILHGLTWWGGVIFQVKKTSPSDEGIQRNILMSALGDAPSLRLAVAVDEDVNIYSAEDVLWAITTRCSPPDGIIRGAYGSRGIPAMPAEKKISGVGGFEGGIGLDCTAPWNDRWRFERPHHPSDQVNLKKWFTEEQINRIRSQQCDYAKVLAEHGW
jgi:3-polyprenyl-4-hydroxybenzoate decarboxylase and related decarboxylases